MFLGNFKSRHLILYGTARLAYFDPYNGNLKGSIDLNLNTQVYLLNNKKWVL